MARLELTGLRADLPIGVMAAFGVLRVLTLSQRVGEPRLSWIEGSGSYKPVLHTPDSVTVDTLTSLLIDDARSAGGRKSLSWTEQIKTVTRDRFMEEAVKVARDATPAEPSDIDWIAGLGSELATDDGKVGPTPFDMSVARQKFPGDALRLAAVLGSADRGRKQKTAAREYEEALFGPWRYEDDQHSFGWDPSTAKLGAFTYKAPTAMANTGVRAAVWLAFESLPLFPVFARGHRQRARAFQQVGGKPVFYWPVWKPPMTLDELKSLLASAALVGEDRQRRVELESRGLLAIYRSAKFKPNKYMVNFLPAELAYSAKA
jgi:hypothetical protein